MAFDADPEDQVPQLASDRVSFFVDQWRGSRRLGAERTPATSIRFYRRKVGADYVLLIA